MCIRDSLWAVALQRHVSRRSLTAAVAAWLAMAVVILFVYSRITAPFSTGFFFLKVMSLSVGFGAVIDNLMFTGERPFDTMAIAMRPEDSERWFKVSPPDLSLIARSRGTDYIYTFLRSFYAAPGRPTGVDNIVLPGTAMPHVLWQLQGTQRAVFHTDEHNAQVFETFEMAVPGELAVEEFDEVVRDIVNFLDYIAEPVKRERQQLGVRVIGFLLVFLLIAYMLKKEIWKDVK